jgi:hypothetical protein
MPYPGNNGWLLLLLYTELIAAHYSETHIIYIIHIYYVYTVLSSMTYVDNFKRIPEINIIY